MEEDHFDAFFEENTKETKTGKFSCGFCKDKKLTFENMNKHFIKTHQKEYEQTPFNDEVKWKDAIEINKKNVKKNGRRIYENGRHGRHGRR